jgi:hypothetical protein
VYYANFGRHLVLPKMFCISCSRNVSTVAISWSSVTPAAAMQIVGTF